MPVCISCKCWEVRQRANSSPQQQEDSRFNGDYIVRNDGGKDRTGIDAIPNLNWEANTAPRLS